jgi:hypothetical protein
MLVNASIIPPRSAVEAVAEVMRSVTEPVPTAQETPAAKGIFGRRGRRREEPEQESSAPPMLEHVPIERMQLPITGFGNLTTNDSRRLVQTITEASATWSLPTVRFAGGTALDFPGDWSVWARVEGDLDELGAVARGVTQSVEALGFFVDRRQFRPMLSVATVTTSTTGPFLESVVGALDAFRGEEWTAAISLTKESFVGGRTEMVEFERIALG